ncbi:chromosome segregation in meiosis- protein [Ascosphaera acerosa]|nr:chromosome segregation in meiosis- protein [Ascosphaera acerosa]
MATDDLFDLDIDDFGAPLPNSGVAPGRDGNDAGAAATTDGGTASGAASSANAAKRAVDDTDLGLDTEIKITKRARLPRPKLDADRLLSDKGLPLLRRTCHQLRLKGKGHEYGDTRRVLAFAQLWLHNLHPSVTFEDGLRTIRKLGHTKKVAKERKEWFKKLKGVADTADGGDPDADLFGNDPKDAGDVGGPAAQGAADDDDDEDDIIRRPSRRVLSGLQAEDDGDDDLFVDEGSARLPGASRPGDGDAGTSDGDKTSDELDALLAEPALQSVSTGGDSGSRSGDAPPANPLSHPQPVAVASYGTAAPGPPASDAHDGNMDELDAILAEQEQSGSARAAAVAEPGDIDHDDDWEAMQEMGM